MNDTQGGAARLHRSAYPGLRCVTPLALLLALMLAVGQSAIGGETYSQKPEVADAQTKAVQPKPEPVEKPKAPPKVSGGPKAIWIWGPVAETNYTLSKSFEANSKSATIIATCDNVMELFINGKSVLSSTNWSAPVSRDVQKFLKQAENEITVKASNEGSVAGFALKLELTADKKKQYVISDKTWNATASGAKESVAVKTLGTMGVGPWGNVFAKPPASSLAGSTPRGIFNVLPGFQVERLFTVPKNELGSWVSITFDNKGRLIASDQGGQGLCRITPPPIGSDVETKIEHLDVKITSAHGMLYAFDSLYVSVNGGPGSGLYRCRDTNMDDQYDEVTKLKALQGGGEHGPHALRLSPDGKSIYVIAGNHTNPPQNFNHSQVPKNWSEDLLLPRQWDARGHARGKLAPGGWIAKTDPDGKTWEIVSTGYRNAYDMDFNADGELFAYDADMEWDMGSPWYRPTRVVHAAGGSDFGWRSGTGKWPTYYVDSLPQLVDVGPGSPVGAEFGYGAKFPAKYQKAFYICDWTFGTMYAIHIQPCGASYTAVKEEFVSRTPLPLTDVAIGHDGAMYFTVGGRGAQSELFRVTYVGDESTDPVDTENDKGSDLRQLRRQLEELQRPDAAPERLLGFITANLGHEDRFVRYAARVALEHQSVAAWQDGVLAEKDAQALITGAVALARQGDKSAQPKLLAALDSIDFAKLDEEAQQLELLRAYALAFIRLGKPDLATASQIAKKFDAFYPAKSNNLNRELCRVLVYLESPTVINKTMDLIAKESDQQLEDISELLARNGGYGGTIANMLANQPDLQKIHYALALRNMRFGWTLGQRKTYFEWLDGARQKSGGASYQGFIDNIRKEALANASEAELAALKTTITKPPIKPTELPKAKGPGHDWKLDELVALTSKGLTSRNFDNGKKMYAATRCVICHRFGGEGGATGPDLTNVAGRFSFKDLGETIVDPSKVISDQYRASTIITTGGKVYTGRVVNDQNGVVTMLIDPEDITKVVELKKDDIDEMAPSKVSLMPKDLLKVLNEEEMLDLLAYLMSRGNPTDLMFQK